MTGWRADRSHVNDAGSPKMPYDTEAGAREAADDIFRRSGRMLQPYRCWMNPEHYHLGSNWNVGNLTYARGAPEQQ